MNRVGGSNVISVDFSNGLQGRFNRVAVSKHSNFRAGDFQQAFVSAQCTRNSDFVANSQFSTVNANGGGVVLDVTRGAHAARDDTRGNHRARTLSTHFGDGHRGIGVAGLCHRNVGGNGCAVVSVGKGDDAFTASAGFVGRGGEGHGVARHGSIANPIHFFTNGGYATFNGVVDGEVE